MSDRFPFRAAFLLVAASFLFALPACDDDSSPGIQPEIVNETDAFQFQVSAVSGYSGILEYTWANTGTSANVDQSTSVTSGRVDVLLLDAAGTQVYSRSLSEDGSFPSDEGVAGNWKVRVLFDRMSGTVNFRAEKRTP